MKFTGFFRLYFNFYPSTYTPFHTLHDEIIFALSAPIFPSTLLKKTRPTNLQNTCLGFGR